MVVLKLLACKYVDLSLGELLILKETVSHFQYYIRVAKYRTNYSAPALELTPGLVPQPAFTSVPGPGGSTVNIPVSPGSQANFDGLGLLSTSEKYMLALVNQERARAALPLFIQNQDLLYLARLKCQDMYEQNYFSHTSLTYGTPYQMMRNAGFSARVMGAENIAKASSVARAHELLMNSDGHRANILDPRHDMIGIGIVDIPGGLYVTQLFAGN